MAKTGPTRRGRLRFNTRGLLILMTVSGLIGGGVAWLRPQPVTVLEVSIEGPMTSGGSARSLDRPSDAEIMQAIQDASTRPPKLSGRDVRIVVQKVADFVDSIELVPSPNYAQRHHAQYKCSVYISSDRSLKERELRYVVLLDHNHMHQFDPAEQ